MAAHDWTSHWFNRSDKRAAASAATATATDTVEVSAAPSVAQYVDAPAAEPVVDAMSTVPTGSATEATAADWSALAIEAATARPTADRVVAVPLVERGAEVHQLAPRIAARAAGDTPTLASTPVGDARVPARVTAAVDADLAADLAAMTRVVLGISDQPVLVAFPERTDVVSAAGSPAATATGPAVAGTSAPVWSLESLAALEVSEAPAALVAPREPELPELTTYEPLRAVPALEPVVVAEVAPQASPIEVEIAPRVLGKRAAAVPVDDVSQTSLSRPGKHAAPAGMPGAFGPVEPMAPIAISFDEAPAPAAISFDRPAPISFDQPEQHRGATPPPLPDSWVQSWSTQEPVEPLESAESWAAPEQRELAVATVGEAVAPALPPVFELEPAFEGGVAAAFGAPVVDIAAQAAPADVAVDVSALRVPDADDLVMPWVQASLEPVAPVVAVVEEEPVTRPVASAAALMRELSFLD